MSASRSPQLNHRVNDSAPVRIPSGQLGIGGATDLLRAGTTRTTCADSPYYATWRLRTLCGENDEPGTLTSSLRRFHSGPRIPDSLNNTWNTQCFVTLAFVFAWQLAHRIGRQGTTRSEVSWAAPGQPVHSSIFMSTHNSLLMFYSLTHTGIAHLCLVPCTATLPHLPAHFPAPAASALAHALQVISVALCDVDGRTYSESDDHR
ncbi:hypothetical protein B0H13DRAFT_2274160 [Mycena leptocephala]|nr:hypothetical protein B0H13DRAFT_2274160 [Mycena leptocephala]